MRMTAEDWMRLALEEAGAAGARGEVPVGCVIVSPEGELLSRGSNRREEKQSALSHAETEAIEAACRARGAWRLTGCSLYVTLEPCPMCAGAILNARLARVYFGARDPSFGACGGVTNVFVEPWGAVPEIRGGILEAECAGILRRFFREMRDQAMVSSIFGVTE